MQFFLKQIHERRAGVADRLQPVDFTLRAATSRFNSVSIRAQCGSGKAGQTVSSFVPETSFWMPSQGTGAVNALLTLARYSFGAADAKQPEEIDRG